MTRPVFETPNRRPSSAPAVFVALPTYDGRVEMEAARSWLLGLTAGRCRVGQFGHRGSLLAYGFNTLWCQALDLAAKGECDRFAMLHADVCPAAGPWLDRLERVLQQTGADVASVVVPIKDTRGLTSTAIGDPADPWRQVKRLTVRECLALPESFRAADCGFPGHPLLVNTGCWMARLDRGDWPGKVHFEIRDRVVTLPDGTRKAQCLPEDWGWSRQLHALGVDVVATRAVNVRHVGRIEFANDQPWGSLPHDDLWDRDRDPVASPITEPADAPTEGDDR